MTDGAPPPQHSNGDDPSKLAQAAMDRAIGSFREVMDTRLSAMDRATELVAIDLSQTRADTDVAQRRLLGALTGDLNALRELLTARLEATDQTVGRVPSDTDKSVGALRELFGARLDGMDTATKVLAASVAKFPSDIDRAGLSVREWASGQIETALAETRRVRDVTQEKFDKVDAQFVSNDKALTAALAAQEKAAAEQQKSNTLAIDKSENTTQETIKANDDKTASSIGAQAQTIADLKDRLVRIESGGVAHAAARTEQHAVRAGGNQMVIISIMAVSILISLISVIAFVLKK